MKAFNLFLADLNDGQTHAGLTADLDELLRTVRNTGRAGSMTLKIKISPASKGGEVDKITINADRKLELPKPEQPSDFFWLTDSAERAIEDAFAGYIEKVRTETGYTVLVGKA